MSKEEIEQLRQSLVGKTVKSVDFCEHFSDDGMGIEFTDGTTLEWGYSSREGSTWINSKELDRD